MSRLLKQKRSHCRVFGQTNRLGKQLINFSLMAAITLTIVAGIQTVGVILVVALMVTPIVSAFAP